MSNEAYIITLRICNEVVGGFKDIGYAFRKQNAFNKTVALFSLATACYISMAEKRRRKQANEIKELKKRVEELENQKGE